MSQLLTKAKRLFRRMSVREKLLSLLFIIVLLGIWTVSLLNRTSAWNQHRRQTSADLATQQQWLDRSDQYEQGLARALERVDPSKTYAGALLSGRIDNILRRVALSDSADIDPVRTREGEIFNDHNIRVRLNRISIAQIIELNKLLSQDTPYINLQSARFTANRRNPEELDVRLEINSFDLKSPQR
jgi:hypothetical protein